MCGRAISKKSSRLESHQVDPALWNQKTHLDHRGRLELLAIDGDDGERVGQPEHIALHQRVGSDDCGDDKGSDQISKGSAFRRGARHAGCF